MASREIYLAFVERRGVRGEASGERRERREGPGNGVARDLSRICGERRGVRGEARGARGEA
ncbi:MAG: hypothetical protein KatS3mg058_4627 [Roseiflexus sp.]|nr:MAG: hypothetical protein KatS3mg058_4627 [Roseiflexus sp.]